MRNFLQLLSAVALAATIVPAVLFLSGKAELEQVKLLMLIATIVWFAVTPLWMGKATAVEDETLST